MNFDSLTVFSWFLLRVYHIYVTVFTSTLMETSRMVKLLTQLYIIIASSDWFFSLIINITYKVFNIRQTWIVVDMSTLNNDVFNFHCQTLLKSILTFYLLSKYSKCIAVAQMKSLRHFGHITKSSYTIRFFNSDMKVWWICLHKIILIIIF